MTQTEANGTSSAREKATKSARDGARETGPAHDLRHLDPRRYEYGARCLDETGRRIGAWMKAHRARKSS